MPLPAKVNSRACRSRRPSVSASKSAKRSPVVTTSALANSTNRLVLRRTSQTAIAAGAQSADTFVATASAHRIPANTARRGALLLCNDHHREELEEGRQRVPADTEEGRGRGRARQDRRNDHKGDVGRRPASSRGDIHQHVERDITV